MTNIKDFENLEAESCEGHLLRIGYTSGEIDEDNGDFEFGFNVRQHCWWNFFVLEDITQELKNPVIVIDLNTGENYSVEAGDTELTAQVIARVCNITADDMFGREFASEAFESVALGCLDELDGYDCVNTIIEDIGGFIEEAHGVEIDEEYVNSLFGLSIHICADYITIKDGKVLIEGEPVDAKKMYQPKYKMIYFTEDVMNSRL